MKKLIPMPTLRMRTHALAAAAVAAFLFAPASAFSQVTLGPGGVTIGPGYQGPGYGPGYGGDYGPRYGGGGYDCARWRQQCAIEGRRCDRVQSFCGGMGGGMARGGMGQFSSPGFQQPRQQFQPGAGFRPAVGVPRQQQPQQPQAQGNVAPNRPGVCGDRLC